MCFSDIISTVHRDKLNNETNEMHFLEYYFGNRQFH